MRSEFLSACDCKNAGAAGVSPYAFAKTGGRKLIRMRACGAAWCCLILLFAALAAGLAKPAGFLYSYKDNIARSWLARAYDGGFTDEYGVIERLVGGSAYLDFSEVKSLETLDSRSCKLTLLLPDMDAALRDMARAAEEEYDDFIYEAAEPELDIEGYEGYGELAKKQYVLNLYTDEEYKFARPGENSIVYGWAAVLRAISQSYANILDETRQAINEEWLLTKEPRPQTGLLWGEASGNKVTVSVPEDAGDVCVRFYRLSDDDEMTFAERMEGGEHKQTVYLRAGNTLATLLPAGDYKIDCEASGENEPLWYGEEKGFGPGGMRNTLDNLLESRDGYESEVSLFHIKGQAVQSGMPLPKIPIPTEKAAKQETLIEREVAPLS